MEAIIKLKKLRFLDKILNLLAISTGLNAKNEEEKEYLFSGCIERRWLVKISQAMTGKVVLEFCTGSRKAVCSVQRVLPLSRTQIPGFA